MAASSESMDGRMAELQAEEIVQQLIELFGNVLDLEIIQSVAFSCGYNLEAASDILLDMSSSVGTMPKQPLQEKKKSNKQKTSNGTVASNHQSNNVTSTSDNINQILSYEKITNDLQYKSSEKHNCYLSDKTNSKLNTSTQKKAVLSQRKSKKEQEFDRVIFHVKQGSRVLILMRGLPGSGKSYLAKQIVQKSIGYTNYSDFILSTDDFFIDRRTGRYVYDRFKLQDAHGWNQHRAYVAMNNGISPIIIDNTNLQTWEMKPYAMLAVNFAYSIEIVEPFTHWAFNDKELARRNLHDVPKVKIKEMLDRYEKNVTSLKLLAMYNLSYASNFKPPVRRNHPPITYLEENYEGNSKGAVKNLVRDDNEIKKRNLQVNQDLMDFETDVHLQSPDSIIDKEKTSSECDLIDSILMYDIHSNSSPDILKPNTTQDSTTVINPNSEPELKKARTFSKSSVDDEIIKNRDDITNFQDPKTVEQIKKARDLYPNLNLSSWGLTDDAVSSWESWDIVKPLILSSELERKHLGKSPTTVSSTTVGTLDSTTNTSYTDFAVLKRGNLDSQHVKVLSATSRNINEGIVRPIINSSNKTLLEKSSMTNEDVLSAALSRERDSNDEKQIAVLISLFPGIPIDYLKDVYEKCGRDINWTGDILLDDKKEFLPFLQANSNDNDSDNSSINKQDNKYEHISDSFQLNMKELSISSHEFDENFDSKKNKSSVEDIEEIKKHIEENIKINKNHYSEHILKIKTQKCGNNYNKLTELQPSTSKASNFELYPTPPGEVIVVDNDVELSNFEPDIDFPENEENEMVELNLGDVAVSQLETYFGFSQMLPQGFLPIIQVPVSLARQLYVHYVESVFLQMENQNQVFDAIAKEDEEFARKLNMQEQNTNGAEGRKTPDLEEIMNEQAATNLYLKETEEWKKLTPDNLAMRLTLQKLYNAFPTVNRDLLMEILHAYDNSYEETVRVLMASTDQSKIHDPDGNVLEPPVTDTVINEMKIAEVETKESAHAPDISKTAQEYREEAAQHHKKHTDLMQKAHQAYQRKQYEVAQFYSDLAKTHTQLYDQANNLAAAAFLQEHSTKLENFRTIDLHYLYVKEAISALDMFLDRNIRLLEGTNKKQENLFVITGRGKRSNQGMSRIKPAVMARLRKRNIWYMEINPGLLKVRVRHHSALTSSIN